MLKNIGKILLILAIFLSLAYIAYVKVFFRTDRSALTLKEIKGTVEKQGDTGQWILARPGESLTRDEGIRTGKDSEALLSMADESLIIVEDRTAISVKELTEAAARFTLHEGRLTADVKERPGRVFKIETEDAGRTAETRGGVFTMTATRDGLIAIASQTGEVNLTAQGKTVRVAQGDQSIALPGEPPKEATAIPTTVYLKVEWPAETKLNTRKIAIGGKTDPGSFVVVKDVKVPAGKDGRFTVRVNLEEGTNTLTVKSMNAAGRTQEETSPELRVDSTAPHLKVKGEDLWK